MVGKNTAKLDKITFILLLTDTESASLLYPIYYVRQSSNFRTIIYHLQSSVASSFDANIWRKRESRIRPRKRRSSEELKGDRKSIF